MASNSSYYLGIDGGGTHSRMAVVGQDGKMIGCYQGASTNITANPVDVVRQHLVSLLDTFLQSSKRSLASCAGLCIGSAGVDTPYHAQMMENIFLEMGLQCPLKVINDGELILWAELEADAGVALISGTGSVAFGKNKQGDTKRVGGWGHLFDDVGSGYWIGIEGLNKAFLSYDGRGPKSMLEQQFVAHFQVGSLAESILPIYETGGNKALLAQLSKIVKETAEMGDEVAVDILQRAAEQLFAHIQTLAKDLSMQEEHFIISASGGTIENNPMIQRHLQKRIQTQYPRASFRLSQQAPVMGASYLARQIAPS